MEEVSSKLGNWADLIFPNCTVKGSIGCHVAIQNAFSASE